MSLSIGKQMLQKLEGYLTTKELAKKLSNAYSTDRYHNGWRSCIRMLRKRGYNDLEIEAIIRSKHTRWAGDQSDHRYGKVTSVDLAKYIDSYPDFKDKVADLVKWTFN